MTIDANAIFSHKYLHNLYLLGMLGPIVPAHLGRVNVGPTRFARDARR
jgi:hypothetical protein